MNPNCMVMVNYDNIFAALPDKKARLKHYFEDENLTGGDETVTIVVNEAYDQALIYFKLPSVAARVLERQKITIGSYNFKVKRGKTSETKRESPKPEEDRDAYSILDEPSESNSKPSEMKFHQSAPLSGKSAQNKENTYRRPVIIDGNNVGLSHGREKLFSCRGLLIAIEYFTKLGHNDVKVVVPRYRRSTKDSDVPTMNPELLDVLKEHDQLVLTPNKIYDDEIILSLAIANNAVVVSNDRFRDFYNDPKIGSFLKSYNTLEYTLSGDTFLVSSMPFGRGKPSLEDVLTRRASNQPCSAPSEKKEKENKPSQPQLANDSKADSLDQTFTTETKVQKPSIQLSTGEFYLLLLKIGTCSENKLKMYFNKLTESESCPLSLVSFGSEKGAVVFKTFSLKSVNSLMSQHEAEKENMPSLNGILIEPVKKTNELIVEADQEIDIDEVKLYIDMLAAKAKFHLEQFRAIRFMNLFVLTLFTIEDVDRVLANFLAKKDRNSVKCLLPYSDKIIEKLHSSESSIAPSAAVVSKEPNKNEPANKAETRAPKPAPKDNYALIKHSYLYDHLQDIRKDIEKEFKIKLKFTGVERSSESNKQREDEDGNSSDASDASDVSSVSTLSKASSVKSKKSSFTRRPRKTRYFRVMIYGDDRRVNSCKKYLEVLNDNLRLIHITYPRGDTRAIHAEALITRKIKEIREEEEDETEKLIEIDEDDERSAIIGIRKNDKTNGLIVFLTSTDEKEAKKLYEQAKDFTVLKKDIPAKSKTLNAMKAKSSEISQEFNVRLFVDFKSNKIEVYYLKSDESDVDKITEMAENIDEENKMKIVTVSPSKEKVLVARYFKAERFGAIRDSLIKSKKAHIGEDIRGRGFYTIKSTSQSNLDEVVQICKKAFDQIEKELVNDYMEFPSSVHDCLMKHRGLKMQLQNLNVIIKAPRASLWPTICLEHKTARLKLFICRGNIVDANTSTIVNSVNDKMLHGGGVARAIADVAGQDYAEECQSLKKPLDPSKVYETTAGDIACAQSIINVICPPYNQQLKLYDLFIKYQLCISQANQSQYQSIAFPLLGAGIFGWPVQTSLQALINASSQVGPSGSLKEIYLIEFNEETFKNIISLIDTQTCTLGNFKVSFNLNKSPKTTQTTTSSLNDPDDPDDSEPTKWYWQDDSNQWKEYRQAISDKINQHAATGKFILNFDGQSYLFDLDKKTQTNNSTQFTRKIQSQIPLETSAQWYWIEDRDREQAYGVAHNQEIEAAFKAQKPYIELKILRHRDDQNCMYRLDFAKMQQINLTTQYVRKMLRKEVDVPVSVKRSNRGGACRAEEDQEENDDPTAGYIDRLESNNFNLKLWLVGKKFNVTKAKIEIDKVVSELKCSTTIEKQNLSDVSRAEMIRNGFKEKTKSSWIKNGVSVVQQGKSIALEGPIRKEVEQVKEELYRMLLNKQQIEYPSTWNLSSSRGDDSGVSFDMFDVKQQSSEWTKIETHFKKTLPQNQITAIQRIQNKNIYKYYFEEKNYLMKKNGTSDANEVYLWHGTRATDPRVIYSSDKCGFDYHQSNEGMWGRGIYFAQNASYSFNYAHQSPTADKKFFYCSVLLGENTPNLASDTNLRMPPLKNPTNPSSRYDSVKGFTGGSDVYIVYDNQKVYPAYLVSFR